MYLDESIITQHEASYTKHVHSSCQYCSAIHGKHILWVCRYALQTSEVTNLPHLIVHLIGNLRIT